MAGADIGKMTQIRQRNGEGTPGTGCHFPFRGKQHVNCLIGSFEITVLTSKVEDLLPAFLKSLAVAIAKEDGIG
jgi:hypothetical protein